MRRGLCRELERSARREVPWRHRLAASQISDDQWYELTGLVLKFAVDHWHDQRPLQDKRTIRQFARDVRGKIFPHERGLWSWVLLRLIEWAISYIIRRLISSNKLFEGVRRELAD